MLLQGSRFLAWLPLVRSGISLVQNSEYGQFIKSALAVGPEFPAPVCVRALTGWEHIPTAWLLNTKIGHQLASAACTLASKCFNAFRLFSGDSPSEAICKLGQVAEKSKSRFVETNRNMHGTVVCGYVSPWLWHCIVEAKKQWCCCSQCYRRI